MPKENAFIGGIKSIIPSSEIAAKKRLPKQTQLVAVNFEEQQVAYLDLSYPRAKAWKRLITYLQAHNRPVYVETDPDTRIITKLCVPEAARVWKIQPPGENVVYVGFHTSSARHYLRRNHPDYQNMLDALQQALDTNATILVTSTLHEFEIIDVRPMPSSYGIEQPQGPPSPSGPDPPVSWDRAVELFNMMNAQSCEPCVAADPCITYLYPYNGCWIRAHLMCYLMINEGETPEKIWIESSDCTLHVDTPNVPECAIDWCWHVAPTLMVEQDSGPDIKMVIDPSLCDEPVTPEQWRLIQSDTDATLTPSSWEQYWPGGGTATQEVANDDMEAFRGFLNDLCEINGSPPYNCPIPRNSFFIVDRSTISKDEVDAMLYIGSPAEIETAFFVVVTGFTPAELGITGSSLTGVPDITPDLTISPPQSQMTVEVMPTIMLEDPDNLVRRQRITWKYKISFTGSNDFVSELQELDLTATTSSITSPVSTVTASAKLYLIIQPNPYEIDGEVTWLSTDLRVFQIRAGESRFNETMDSNASDFITNAIANLNNNTAGGDTFEGISVDQQTSRLELSQTVGSDPVYNFAIAKVRYRARSVSADNVRVFFRLFPVATTSLAYNEATGYRRSTQDGTTVPLLGIIDGEVATIPCFAAPRIDASVHPMTEQEDPANVQTIPADADGHEVVQYFGCWLDFNQTEPRFPLNPALPDGPYSGTLQSIQDLIRGQHQCFVAEIAFDPAPIPAGATPSLSDKLAQRNLAIVESANPGDFASHRIPHTFEIKPTRSKLGPDEVLDELMIDWGNTPVGSRATIYLPGTDTNDVLKFAVDMYRSHTLLRVDSHTLQCETGGVTYIPIPQGEGSNYVGMLLVDLPEAVTKGQIFTIVVRQVTRGVRRHATVTHAATETVSPSERRILGAFQITIPVREKEKMLACEERLLSNLRWIGSIIPGHNRWSPVFDRYLQQIARRVDALGGDSSKVAASPSGQWQEAYTRCRILSAYATLLFTLFLVSAGTLSGGLPAIVGSPLFILLIAAVYLWRKTCRPKLCQLLRSALIGAGLGTIILFFAVFVLSTPQLLTTLIISAGLTFVTAILSWVKGCFR